MTQPVALAPPGTAAGPGSLLPLWRPVAAYVASRVGILLAQLAATAARPDLDLSDTVMVWDSGWYLDVVQSGYADDVPVGASNIAFFPVYPLLGRVVAALPGVGAADALWAVSVLGGLLATVLLWLLTRRVAGGDAADRAATLFAFAPGAFVFSLLYSEGVFLAAAIAGCWLLLRRSWVAAGLACALATGARPNGVVLVLVAATSAALAIRRDRDWSSLAAPALAPVGFIAYMGYTWFNTGRIDAWLIAQRQGWGEGLSLTARARDAESTLRWLVGDVPPDWNRIVATVGAVLAIAGFALLLRLRLPIELVLFTAAICGMSLVSGTLGLRPRFLLTAFPLTMALGVWLRDRTAHAVVLAVSAVAMAALAVISATSFYLTP